MGNFLDFILNHILLIFFAGIVIAGSVLRIMKLRSEKRNDQIMQKPIEPPPSNYFDKLVQEVLAEPSFDLNYNVLELSPDASPDEVVQRCKYLVRQWSPDQYKHDAVKHQQAIRKMQEIQGAYNAIMDAKPLTTSSPNNTLNGNKQSGKVNANTVRPRRWYGWIWPDIYDIPSAEHAVKYGFWTAVWSSLIYICIGLFYPATLLSNAGNDKLWFLFTGILTMIMSFLLWRKSRTAAVLCLIITLFGIILKTFENLKPGIDYLFILYFISAIRGTFAYHRYKNE